MLDQLLCQFFLFGATLVSLTAKELQKKKLNTNPQIYFICGGLSCPIALSQMNLQLILINIFSFEEKKK